MPAKWNIYCIIKNNKNRTGHFLRKPASSNLTPSYNLDLDFMTVFSASSAFSHTLSLSLYHTHSPRVLMKCSALLSPLTLTALSYMTFSKCPFQFSSSVLFLGVGGGGLALSHLLPNAENTTIRWGDANLTWPFPLSSAGDSNIASVLASCWKWQSFKCSGWHIYSGPLYLKV